MSYTPDCIRHSYKVSKCLKSYTVFELSKPVNNLLTDILRIEEFRGKSNAYGIKDYLTLRTSTSWSKSEQVTGLRPTKKEGLFYGDRISNGKKSLLIFQFLTDRNELIIDVYRSFYPEYKGILENIIKSY